MGFNTTEKVTWDDIQELYTSLNSARTKFTLATVDIPSNPGLTIPDSVKTLNDSVNDMSTVSFLTDVAVTGVIVPSSKERLKGEPFHLISNTIEKILNICPHDPGSGGGGGGGGDGCSSNRGGFFFGFGGHGSFVCDTFGGAARDGDRTNSGCFGHKSSCYNYRR